MTLSKFRWICVIALVAMPLLVYAYPLWQARVMVVSGTRTFIVAVPIGTAEEGGELAEQIEADLAHELQSPWTSAAHVKEIQGVCLKAGKSVVTDENGRSWEESDHWICEIRIGCSWRRAILVGIALGKIQSKWGAKDWPGTWSKEEP